MEVGVEGAPVPYTHFQVRDGEMEAGADAEVRIIEANNTC